MNGAGNGVRTRDPELGKLVLYQLSYTRFKLHNKSLRWLIASPKTALAVLAKRHTRSQLDGGFCVFLPALDAINMFDRRHVPRTFGA